jgi:hypothetical protein
MLGLLMSIIMGLLKGDTRLSFFEQLNQINNEKPLLIYQ